MHRRLQEQVAGRVARLRACCAARDGRPGSGRARARSDSGGAGTPRRAGDHRHLAHVLVALVGDRAGRRRSAGGRRGSCRPRRRAPIATGAGRWRRTGGRRARRRRRARARHARARSPARPRRPGRTWWPPGSRRCAAGDATGRRGSRCAGRRLPSPAGAATAAATPAARRRTSRCRRGRAGSRRPRRTSARPRTSNRSRWRSAPLRPVTARRTRVATHVAHRIERGAERSFMASLMLARRVTYAHIVSELEEPTPVDATDGRTPTASNGWRGSSTGVACPSWVVPAVVVFWVGFLVRRARSSTCGHGSTASMLLLLDLAVLRAGDRARCQPPGPARLAARSGDGADPARRACCLRARVRRCDRHARRHAGRRPAAELRDLHHRHRRQHQRHVRHRARPAGRDRRVQRSRRRVQEFIDSQQDNAVQPLVAGA